MNTCYLIGIGMGNPDTLTVGAARIIERCGLLIGARRMLEAFPELFLRQASNSLAGCEAGLGPWPGGQCRGRDSVP